MLAGAREDITTALGAFLGQPRAKQLVDGMFAEVKAEAEKGAREGVVKEIPTIESRVRSEARSALMPFLLVAIALGVTGIGIGIYTLRQV